MFLSASVFSCGSPKEASVVLCDMYKDSTGLGPVKTNLGYNVTLEVFSLSVRGVTFALKGEQHVASWFERLFVPNAYAHPGHTQLGDITGHWDTISVLDFHHGETLQHTGQGSLLEGHYESANIALGQSLLPENSMPFTFHFKGKAVKNNEEVSFDVSFLSPEARIVTGVPGLFGVSDKHTCALALKWQIEDDLEHDTLFDDIVFTTQQPFSEDTKALLQRRLQTHDHVRVVPVLQHGMPL